MRGPFAVLALLIVPIVVLPGSVGEATEEDQVFFRDDFEAGAEGWWGDPGWGLTDNRAASGHAMYFGEDEGTATPEDNHMSFCVQTFCTHELRSPVFYLPGDVTAILYFWTFAAVHSGFRSPALTVDVETIDAEGHPSARQPMFGTNGSRDWIERIDLSDFAGEHLRIVFTIQQVFLLGEGLYLDDVVVTEADVDTTDEAFSSVNGPTVHTTWSSQEGDQAMIESRISGRWAGDSIGVVFRLENTTGFKAHFGVLSADGPRGGFHQTSENVTSYETHYYLSTELEVQVFGVRIVDQEVLVANLDTNGVISVTSRIDTAGHADGDWRLTISLIGVEQPEGEVRVLTQKGASVSVATGGREVSRAFPADLHATFLTSLSHASYALIEGHGAWRTHAEAFVWTLAAFDETVGLQIGSPEGPLEPYGLRWVPSPGVWHIDVGVAYRADAYAFPWIVIGEMPGPRDMETLPPVDHTGIPFGARLGDTVEITSGERIWEIRHGIMCQARLIAVETDTRCGLYPLVVALAELPIAVSRGLRTIGFDLTQGAGFDPLPPSEVGRICLRVTVETAYVACGDKEISGTFGPSGGDSLLSEVDRVLRFQVEKEDPGLSFAERYTLRLVLDHDLTAVRFDTDPRVQRWA